MKSFDIIVVGGGLIGLSTALGLSKQNFTIALVDPYLNDFLDKESPDLRVSALFQSSINILKKLEVWSELPSEKLCYFNSMEVYEHEHSKIELSAKEFKRSYVGCFVENFRVQTELLLKISEEPGISTFKSKVCKLDILGNRHNEVSLLDGNTLKSKYIVAADGVNSSTRQLSDIGVTSWKYNQECLIVNIKSVDPFVKTTWQKFFSSGAKAFLPLYENYASLIWYDDPDKIKCLTQLDSNSLKQELLEQFPERLGDFDVLAKGSFPISRLHAHNYIKNNVILIGDAAHSIHPLAGQGVNLGFKDLEALLRCFEDKICPTNSYLIKHYETLRKRDNSLIQNFMDLFYCGFSCENLLVERVRNKVLNLCGKNHYIKRKIHDLINT